MRDTATVDLRGLPKGRFKVQIAVTLKTGKVVTLHPQVPHLHPEAARRRREAGHEAAAS